LSGLRSAGTRQPQVERCIPNSALEAILGWLNSLEHR
jgi:hypothetical protein